MLKIWPVVRGMKPRGGAVIILDVDDDGRCDVMSDGRENRFGVTTGGDDNRLLRREIVSMSRRSGDTSRVPARVFDVES